MGVDWPIQSELMAANVIGASMSISTAAPRAQRRWVFGEYIIYCSNAYTARRIYEVAYNRPDKAVCFGPVHLTDGLGGSWVVMPSRAR